MLSIMLNIAEGFARRGDRQFAQLLAVAHGSTAEVQSALYIALDQEYIDHKTFDLLYDKSTEVSRTIAGLIRYLRKG